MRDEGDIHELHLLRRVSAGDRAAFKALFDTHSAQVYNLCLRLLGNRDDALEVSQDVFLSLWTKAGSIRGDSKLSTWLYRVTANKAINFKKRGGILAQIKNVFSLDSDSGSLVEQLRADQSSRPDRQLEMRHAEAQLADLLAALPRRQREIYLLHKLEGLSYKEIAEELRVTLAVVESAMHRAKVNLQKAMANRIKKARK